MVLGACACASAIEAGMIAAGDAIRIQTPPAGAVSSSSAPLPFIGAQRLSFHAGAARFGNVAPSASQRIATIPCSERRLGLCNANKAEWVTGTKSSTFRSLPVQVPMSSSWNPKGSNCFGVPCTGTVIASAVSTPATSDTQFVFPSAPMQLPEGPWKEVEGGVNAPKGFRAAGMYAGLRAVGEKPDLALVVCDADAVVAGAFTLNVVAAAPVQYCREVLKRTNVAKAVLINAGQANAATGEEGQRAVLESCAAAAEVLGVPVDSVLVESTGVIGQQIKKTELISALPKLASLLSSSAEAAESAAIAITTTDLVSKSVAIETEIGGTTVRVGGMAKGSGMIHPNMATLLSVVTCDAAVTADVWRSLVSTAVSRSFNQITVDGDTSTNDSVIALASGAAGGSVILKVNSKEAQQLQMALDAVCQGLAKSIASDGEGATVLMEVSVSGAPDDASAATVARSVAASSLVKSAVYGRDPNWGRLACAAGYAGIAFDPNDLKISLGTFLLMEAGQPQSFDRAGASAYLKQKGDCHGTVHIDISIGSGPGHSKAWGCDLSYDYVKINAEYTT